MVAMNDLARQIADKKAGPRSSEHVATVVGKDAQGTYWVSIPGGAERTPVATALIEASAGDTVMVAISDGRCIMSGNVSSPGASTRSVSRVGAIANMAMTTAYSEKARIDELSATAITAQSAIITDLQADTAKVHDLTAQQLSTATAYIGTLNAGNVTANDIIADHAAIGSIDVAEIEADHAIIGSLDTTYAQIDLANIANGTIKTAMIDDGQITSAKIQDGTIQNADIANATIDSAKITNLLGANGWIDRLMVQTGLIANDGAVFTLDAIKVNAVNITAGTIDIERMVVTDPQTGDKHMVTWNSATQTWDAAKLDGDVIGDHTITADKIVAHSITAQEITTQNLVGTNGWINLAAGTFQYINAVSGDGIAWDGTNLTINASSIDMSIENAIDGIRVGGRNLFAGMPVMATVTGNDSSYTIDRTGEGTVFVGKLDNDTEYTVTSFDDAADRFRVILFSDDPLATSPQAGHAIVNDVAKGTFTFDSGSYNYVLLVTRTSSAGYDEFARAKLERGNMPTDWTPPPEDIQVEVDDLEKTLQNDYTTKAELAVESDRITSSIEELSESVAVNSSSIEQNADSISSVVEGLGQSSHFTQTATGFEFSLDSAIDDAARTATDYLSYNSTTGELTLAKSDSEISQVLTNERNAFRTDAGDMLWVGLNHDNDTWEVHSEILFAEDMVRFGNYAFIKRQNGNMSLKWLGDDV